MAKWGSSRWKISCSNTIVASLDVSSLKVCTCTQAGLIVELFKFNNQYPNIVTELKVAGSKIAFIFSEQSNRTAVLHVFDGEVGCTQYLLTPLRVISWPMMGSG